MLLQQWMTQHQCHEQRSSVDNFMAAATNVADAVSPECNRAHELGSVWCAALVHPLFHVRWRGVTTTSTNMYQSEWESKAEWR